MSTAKPQQDGQGLLKSTEYFWRDHQKWLQERGYILRPRFRPGWKPSWIEKGIDDYGCEDAQPLRVRLTFLTRSLY